GGFGTLFGPLVGTVGVVWITQSLQFLEDYRMIIFGPLIVVLVIFMPRGVTGTFLGWKLRKDTEAARAQDPKATSKVTPGSEVNNNA
ncbi:MAG: branched-chain amino acid ABC transporter permease, partial [Gammaproteobacteria bacterium]|nr:branched-chain amino acid ABC transporter permease [Gammaproteobacteria bacterium]MBU1461191.1 branched-chain amino acid ABC transporter permease [Gammaproteobacteria bacterium]